jgi:AAA domain
MTDTLSRTLGPPATWTEELCARRNPDLIGAEPGDAGGIVLSYPPRQLADWEVDLDAVRADFEDGVRIRPGHPHPGGRRFWLDGNQYEAEILAKRADGHSRPIAFVLRLSRTPANTVPRRAGRISCPVDFASVHEERQCDIAALYEHVQRAERYRAARASAGRTVHHARRDAQATQHGDLHGSALKRYGALRGLLSLLALRAERSVATAQGVIMSADEDDAAESGYLYVQISEHDRPLGEFNDAHLEITGEGSPVPTRARNLSGQVIALDMPRRGRWAPGTAVTLTTVPRFSMKQHDRALERFLRGDVDGDWDDLAALLCKPTLLDLTSRPLPPRFFCDEDPDEDPLNDAQRLAVAGALATPHAFVIQGPPGTGKTTVICEIIRQLVSRKQRILMLAPQHVAVDEVLRRIGRKPGVRALRLSWDESKVDERVQGFLPDQVGKEFVGALRRPGPDNDTHWAARHAGLIAEGDAVDRLLTAQHTRYQAGTALAEAEAAQAGAQRRLDEARAWLDRECQQRQDEVVAARQTLGEAQQAAELAARAAEQAQAGFDTARPPIDELAAALDELRDAETELGEAAAAKAEAEQQHARYQDNWAKELDRADRALAASEEPWRDATSAAAEAYQRLHAATARLAELPGRHRAGSRLVDRLGIGAGARRHAEAEKARQEWVDREREREQLEAERQRWIAEQDRLNTDATPGRLAADAAEAGERLVAARQNRRRASARWQEAAGAASGETLPEPGQPATAAAALRAVLRQPATAPPLPAQLAPVRFRQAHDRLRAARAASDEQVADRSSAQELLLAAERSFREARANGQAEHERISLEVSAAATVVRGAEAALERATHELGDAMTALGYAEPPDPAELAERRERLSRKIRVLPRYPELRRRWLEIVGGFSDAQLAADTGEALLRSVNVVCATTTGIAGRSAESVRQVDFDTLIVDEASRVIDSEFLIGAVRARRWILVGDEHQLPPYVEQDDEYFLHALTALYRHERGEADSLEDSVAHLAKLWQEEDEELRRFREKTVSEKAAELCARGEWPGAYLDAFADARQYFAGADPDREFLRAMREHLVKSLLERVTASSRRSLREPLVIQRRMIEPMAEIVRLPVYRGQYQTPTAKELRRCGVSPLITQTFDHPIVFLDTSARGREAQHGHGFINELERDWIANACRIYERELTGSDQVTVSILCFYLAQAMEIRKRLKAPRYPGFRRLTFERIDPIDKIQGQQSDIVFISFCRSNPRPGQNFGQWLQDLRRLNVACTRARRALILVGHWEMLSRLRTFESARTFYGNLFGLFDTAPDHFLHLKDF